jgi:hypothetical protein
VVAVGTGTAWAGRLTVGLEEGVVAGAPGRVIPLQDTALSVMLAMTMTTAIGITNLFNVVDILFSCDGVFEFRDSIIATRDYVSKVAIFYLNLC